MADFVPMDKKPPLDKVVLVGSPGVGKSTIFQRFRTGKFVAADQFSHRDRAEHSKEWTVSETKVSVSPVTYQCVMIIIFSCFGLSSRLQ